jgi:hypothetical protein
MDLANKGPLLLVIRLKPGETQTFELGTPRYGFHPNGVPGRHYLNAQPIPKPDATDKPEAVYPNDQGVGSLGGGLELVWERDRPAISFRAAVDAKPGTTDVGVNYCVFAFQGDHFIGFRVVVEAEEANHREVVP